MRNFITQEVGKYLADYKDEIISIAGTELAKKLANSKRGKELLESFDQCDIKKHTHGTGYDPDECWSRS